MEAVVDVQEALQVVCFVVAMQVEVGPPGDTISQPMDRYMAYALTLESGDTRRITCHSKSKIEIPNPKRTLSHRASKRK